MTTPERSCRYCVENNCCTGTDTEVINVKIRPKGRSLIVDERSKVTLPSMAEYGGGVSLHRASEYSQPLIRCTAAGDPEKQSKCSGYDSKLE